MKVDDSFLMMDDVVKGLFEFVFGDDVCDEVFIDFWC